MVEFIKPRIKVKEESPFKSEFIVEPLERGFGYTLGNTLRRVLLSCLPGAAIASVKIEGVAHEFSTIPNVKEDVTNIILNLKKLVLRCYSNEPVSMTLKAKGPRVVTAADIDIPGDVEIVNTDQVIATLNKKGKIEMELTVEKGRGYVPAERNKKPTDAIGVIPIDSIFTPIRRVTYKVENTRVEQRTDYDKLLLTVETNGALTADEAVSIAAKVVNEHTNLFIERAPEEAQAGSVFASEGLDRDKILDQPIEELELSVRSYNCLKKQGIDVLGQLVGCSEQDLMNIRNFGAKSIDEIKGKLKELDLELKD